MLAGVPVLAVIAIFGSGLGAALASGRGRFGLLVMMLGVPMVAAGLSFDDVSEAVAVAALPAVGSMVTWLVALAATLVADLGPPAAVMAALVLVDLVLLAGTRTSRWYVTGGFTTFIVISLILSTSDTVSSQPLSDRVIETVIGVGAALVFTSFHVLRPVRQREL